MVDDNKTIGRWGPRTPVSKMASYGPGKYKILFTKGDELLTPQNYRASFDQSLQRALGGSSKLGDYEIGRAFAVSASAYTCIEYRSGTTAAIPLIVVNPSRKKMENTPLTYFADNSARIIGDVVRSLLGWGRVYLRKRYNAKGWPTGLEWVNPQTIREITGDKLRVVAYDIRNAVTNEVERVPVQQIIYKQMFDPDPAGMGQSKFEVAWRAMGVEQGVVTYAAAFFINGAAPDGFLSFDKPLSDDEYEDAKNDWKQFKGAKNAHRTAVMPGGAKWNPIQSVNKDLAMVELKDSEREDIHAIFDTDPILTGMKGAADPLSSNSTFSTSEVAHIRRVTIPMLMTIILPALNEQWAHTDFDQRNTYTLMVDETAIPALAEANLTKADTAVSLSSTVPVLDYNETRKLIGFAEREGAYLARNPDEAISVWQAGGLTRNQFMELIGVPGYQYSPLNDVVMMGGQLFPVAKLYEIAEKNAAAAGQPPPSPFGTMPPNNPPLPPPAPGAVPSQIPAPDAPAEALALPETIPATGKSGILLLAMPNQPDLINLQGRVQQIMGEVPVKWNTPDDFHVTMVYMPSMTDEQVTALSAALPDIEVPDLSLRVGQLNVFDNLGEHALHFRISRNADLIEFQDVLYQTCQALGIPLSAYSNPNDFKPHITMGYSEQPIKRIIFNSSLKVAPTELRFIVEDQIVYQSAHNPPIPGRRSDMPLTVGISFADHTFVKQARRKLSDALTEQGVQDVSWLPESQWQVTLSQTDEWTPSAVSKILKDADYGDLRKFDLQAARFITAPDGLSIYLNVSGDAEALRKAVQMDLNGAGIARHEFAPTFGVLLAKLNTTPEKLVLPQIDPLPLVANNLTLYLGGEAYHAWPLRGVSLPQQKELSAWRRAASNKGADYDFHTEALTSWAGVEYVRDMLAAGVSIEDTFAIAESALKGEYEFRAYADTRSSFIEELVSIIADGQANEINRRNFSARMRTSLRKFGLPALRDGLNEGGSDPESLAPETVKLFNEWLSKHSAFVSSFGEEVFKQGISEGEVRVRATMWADVSLDEVRVIGVIAAGDKMLRRVLGQVLTEHCPECKVLADQVHPASEWKKRDLLIGTMLTTCKQGCHCSFIVTDEPERGNWLE